MRGQQRKPYKVFIINTIYDISLNGHHEIKLVGNDNEIMFNLINRLGKFDDRN